MLKPLKYISYAIVFQEVPNEISLVFNISGCPHHCEGCHSQYLWDYEGDNLLPINIINVINKYKDYITCVCFMGGDQNIEELTQALKTCKNLGYKTCLYSGASEVSIKILKYLDWIKLGKYDKKLESNNHIEHGVKLATTNQHMYKIEHKDGKVMIT